MSASSSFDCKALRLIISSSILFCISSVLLTFAPISPRTTRDWSKNLSIEPNKSLISSCFPSMRFFSISSIRLISPAFCGFATMPTAFPLFSYVPNVKLLISAGMFFCIKSLFQASFVLMLNRQNFYLFLSYIAALVASASKFPSVSNSPLIKLVIVTLSSILISNL